jgi:hypothetical protein
MAKAAKALCGRCENRVTVGDPYCGSCGYPSAWATHDERTAWEVAQYRHKTASVPIGVPFDRLKPTVVIDRPKPSRRIGLFARKSHAPQLLMPEPSKEKVAEPILKAVPAQPEPPAMQPVPAAKPAPVAKPAPRVKARANDAKPATDTPATVLAMRLLNARVAELDAKVHELQRQIESMNEVPRSGFGS